MAVAKALLEKIRVQDVAHGVHQRLAIIYIAARGRELELTLPEKPILWPCPWSTESRYRAGARCWHAGMNATQSFLLGEKRFDGNVHRRPECFTQGQDAQTGFVAGLL